MIDSPLMQQVDRETVDSLRLVIKALESDKKNLSSQLIESQSQIEKIKKIIQQGDKVKYCAACGLFYASGNRCDCTAGIDY